LHLHRLRFTMIAIRLARQTFSRKFRRVKVVISHEE
jgi:hypothetical protein